MIEFLKHPLPTIADRAVFDRVLDCYVALPVKRRVERRDCCLLPYVSEPFVRPPLISETTELIEWTPKRTYNRDMPDNLVYYEQGTAYLRNPHIDEKASGDNLSRKAQGHYNDAVRRWESLNHFMHGRCLNEFSAVLAEIRKAHAGRIERTHPKRHMDAAHFRELCVQRADSHNHALYQKSSNDFDAAQHLQPEWLHEKLDIEFVDAVSLGQFFRRMKMDRKRTLQFIFGYTTESGQRKTGCQDLVPSQFEYYLPLFESWAESLPEIEDPSQSSAMTLDDHREFYAHASLDMDFESVFEQIDYIESASTESVDIGGCVNPLDVDRMINLGFDPADAEPEDRYDLGRDHWNSTLGNDLSQPFYRAIRPSELDANVLMETVEYLGFDANPYSTFALHYGEDAIDWDLASDILDASYDALQTIIDWYYDGADDLFTPQQRNSFWAYVNARRQTLCDEYRERLAPATQMVLEMIQRMGATSQTKALIMAYKHGSEFVTDTDYLEFDQMHRPSDQEMYVLWNEYRAM